MPFEWEGPALPRETPPSPMGETHPFAGYAALPHEGGSRFRGKRDCLQWERVALFVGYAALPNGRDARFS